MLGKEFICVLENPAPEGWEEIPITDLQNRTADFLGQEEMSRTVDGFKINNRRIENKQGKSDRAEVKYE